MIRLILSLTAPLIYPIAYTLRGYIRSSEPFYKCGAYNLMKWRAGFFILWAYLNDSEYFDGTGTEYGDNPNYYPSIIWKAGNFARSYWFNAVRNHAVNFNNYCAAKLGAWRYDKVLIKCGSFLLLKRMFQNGTGLKIQFFIFDKYFGFGYAKSGRFWCEVC